MHKPLFTIKPMIFPIGILSLAASFAVQAAPVTHGNYTLDAQYALGAMGQMTQDGMSDPNAWIATYANGADYYLSNADGTNSVFFHTYGYDYDDSSTFGARASGEGGFYARTTVNYNATYTNTGDEAMPFLFSFGVEEGELGVYGIGTGYAALSLSIKINGIEIAASNTGLLQFSQGVRSCGSDSFGLLADYMDCANTFGDSIIAAGRNFTLDLGLIAAGESFTLDYDITAVAWGDMSVGEVTHTTYYACDEYVEWKLGDVVPEGVVVSTGDNVEVGHYCKSGHYETTTFTNMGGAIARSGDPLNPYWTPANIDGRFVDPNPSSSDVPEPSSVALFGLAFAGLAVIRRRRA
ncbi:PEP-CTERM sorting domain-containing protein [Azonexus sp.]|jgi:hypothetical protein|uniref:PEP-CTERM sorting domain-containing protein n=1 Tax=Azonexus sp. TaxID=1872668 RepID=UPI002828D714|nr:PEP-CTERM sorting domain-containing protein [Azonexus sp.]MDR1995651.1 PEP-CTERM sorting domain-containing protein [Azonexus sp.]